MNSAELIRKLRRLGATVDASHGKGSHQMAHLAGRTTVVPSHGKKELGTGLIRKICKDLGIPPGDL